MKTILLSMLVMMSAMGVDELNFKQIEMELEEQKLMEAKSEGVEIVQPIEIFFMYGNEDGTYWLDANAEEENVIFVGYDSLIEWGIDFKTLHHGHTRIGLFDETGWELLEIVKEI